jgi:hypothetical protein
LISFLFSTILHISCVFAYYYIYLKLNPDDPGQKNFYSSTTVSPGVNIGGRVIGGGGIQTNTHKSYLIHLAREYYKSLSKMFLIEFSLIYLMFLFLFKFFTERAKLKEDTFAALQLYKIANQAVPKGNIRQRKLTRLGKNSFKNYCPIETVDDEYVTSHSTSIEDDENSNLINKNN